jgi:hypothetical protein
VETHVKVLAVLHIVFGVCLVLIALVVLGAFSIAGIATAAGASGGDAVVALPIIGLTGTALFVILLIFSLPALLGGIGLLKFQPWARILVIVLSALNILNFPLGTMLGAYGLYVLLSKEGSRLFEAPPPVVTSI